MSSGELAQLVRARSILKAADLDRILSVEHYLANARATADLVMQEANHRALKMSAETQLAADRLKIEARESGYQQGLQQAREEQAESIVRNQTELARSWMQKDQKISFLVTQILGKILAESDAQPHFFAAVTRRALRTVRDQRLLVFKVSPEQLDIARSCVARALAEHHAPGFVEVLGEPEIPVAETS